jgi:hypothetical protein
MPSDGFLNRLGVSGREGHRLLGRVWTHGQILLYVGAVRVPKPTRSSAALAGTARTSVGFAPAALRVLTLATSIEAGNIAQWSTRLRACAVRIHI